MAQRASPTFGKYHAENDIKACYSNHVIESGPRN